MGRKIRYFIFGLAVVIVLTIIFFCKNTTQEINKAEEKQVALKDESNKYLLYMLQQNFPNNDNSVLSKKENILDNGDFSNNLQSWEPYESKVQIGTLNNQIWADAIEKKTSLINFDKAIGIAALLEEPKNAEKKELVMKNSTDGSTFVYIKEDNKEYKARAIKINAEKNRFVTIKKGKHSWIHQRVKNTKPGFLYVLSFNYISFPNNAIGAVLLGKYGGSPDSTYQTFESDNTWRHKYIVYENSSGPVDVILYGENEQPIAYSNIALYEISKEEIKNMKIANNQDKRTFYKNITDFLEIRDQQSAYSKKKNNAENIQTIITTKTKDDYTNLFKNKFKNWLSTTEWKRNRFSSASAKKVLKKFVLRNSETALPVIAKWHPGLTSRQYMILYIQYLTHVNLLLNRPDNISRENYKEKIEFLEAECWRGSLYTGELLNIVLGETGKIATMSGHTVMAGKDFISDSNYNVLFLFDVDASKTYFNMPASIRKSEIVNNAIYGIPNMLVSTEKTAIHLNKEEVKADYKLQIEKYLDNNDGFPIISKTSIDAVL